MARVSGEECRTVHTHMTHLASVVHVNRVPAPGVAHNGGLQCTCVYQAVCEVNPRDSQSSLGTSDAWSGRVKTNLCVTGSG